MQYCTFDKDIENLVFAPGLSNDILVVYFNGPKNHYFLKVTSRDYGIQPRELAVDADGCINGLRVCYSANEENYHKLIEIYPKLEKPKFRDPKAKEFEQILDTMLNYHAKYSISNSNRSDYGMFEKLPDPNLSNYKSNRKKLIALFEEAYPPK